MMNGLYIKQDGQFYSIYTPQGILIAQVFMGADNQIWKDLASLKVISATLKKRWNISD